MREVILDEELSYAIENLKNSSYEERLYKIGKIIEVCNINDHKELSFVRKMIAPFHKEVEIIYNKL